MHPEHKTLRDNYFPIVAALVVRDGYICAGCNAFCKLVVDHIVSVKNGGVTELDNLQFLCKRCNRIKASDTADYRPANRGNLGREAPRYSKNGLLIIHTFTYHHFPARFDLHPYEVLQPPTRYSIRLRRLDGSTGPVTKLHEVYPPDLQHIY